MSGQDGQRGERSGHQIGRSWRRTDHGRKGRGRELEQILFLSLCNWHLVVPFTEAGDMQEWAGQMLSSGLETAAERTRRGLERVFHRRRKVSFRGQRGAVWAWWLPCVRTCPPSPYLLPFGPRTAGGSIKSRLSLGALENISDNQPTTSLIRIKYKGFLHKEAGVGRTQEVRLVAPGPVPGLWRNACPGQQRLSIYGGGSSFCFCGGIRGQGGY